MNFHKKSPRYNKGKQTEGESVLFAIPGEAAW